VWLGYFQTMVDVIPASNDDIPSKDLDETWDLPFNEEGVDISLVCYILFLSNISKYTMAI